MFQITRLQSMKTRCLCPVPGGAAAQPVSPPGCSPAALPSSDHVQLSSVLRPLWSLGTGCPGCHLRGRSASRRWHKPRRPSPTRSSWAQGPRCGQPGAASTKRGNCPFSQAWGTCPATFPGHRVMLLPRHLAVGWRSPRRRTKQRGVRLGRAARCHAEKRSAALVPLLLGIRRLLLAWIDL